MSPPRLTEPQSCVSPALKGSQVLKVGQPIQEWAAKRHICDNKLHQFDKELPLFWPLSCEAVARDVEEFQRCWKRGELASEASSGQGQRLEAA